MTVAFCFDEQLLGGRHRSGPRTQFMLESLAELGDELKDRGSRLFVLDGDPATELRAARRAGRRHRVALQRRRRPVRAAAPARGQGGDGRAGRRGRRPPGPVLRRLAARHPHRRRRSVHGVHAVSPQLAQAAAARGAADARQAAAAGREPRVSAGCRRCSRSGSKPRCPSRCRAASTPLARRCERFLDGRVDGYAEHHDTLTGESVSRLSPVPALRLHLAA